MSKVVLLQNCWTQTQQKSLEEASQENESARASDLETQQSASKSLRTKRKKKIPNKESDTDPLISVLHKTIATIEKTDTQNIQILTDCFFYPSSTGCYKEQTTLALRRLTKSRLAFDRLANDYRLLWNASDRPAPRAHSTQIQTYYGYRAEICDKSPTIPAVMKTKAKMEIMEIIEKYQPNYEPTARMPARRRVSMRQMEILLEFMESHRDIALVSFVGGPLGCSMYLVVATKVTREAWESVAGQLNLVGEGTTRTPGHWRRTPASLDDIKVTVDNGNSAPNPNYSTTIPEPPDLNPVSSQPVMYEEWLESEITSVETKATDTAITYTSRRTTRSFVKR
ncbi:unnamed protein product [Leptidea sinapis]|uniref:Uncharacterized protein n=1 Tax=Leptidea sinapis TaxID=189913 RepID=A0A5E4R345_9NEOP|nr:unnamed protein product [Leptidea sinapis]